MKFKVIREHHGDKPYAAGEVREAELADVGHLIPNVLQPAKAEVAHINKAGPVLSNKGTAGRKAKA